MMQQSLRASPLVTAAPAQQQLLTSVCHKSPFTSNIRAAASSSTSSSSWPAQQQVHCSSSRRAQRRAPLAPVAAAAPAATANAAEELRVVDVDLGDRSYPIYIGQNLLEDGARLRQHIPGNRVLIVTNETIKPLYLQK
jgi:3-dehydroquinate synthase